MSQVRVPVAPLHVTTLGKLFAHNVPLFTKQYKLVPAIGWEGNRRSGVALAMRHRLSSISTYTGSMVLEREMSTPPTLHWSTTASLPLPLLYVLPEAPLSQRRFIAKFVAHSGIPGLSLGMFEVFGLTRPLILGAAVFWCRFDQNMHVTNTSRKHSHNVK